MINIKLIEDYEQCWTLASVFQLKKYNSFFDKKQKKTDSARCSAYENLHKFLDNEKKKIYNKKGHYKSVLDGRVA